MSNPAQQENIHGWILYDDSCGFCRTWVPLWQKALLKRGFSTACLQDDWVRAKIPLPEDELLNDLRLLLADGRHLAGPEVYRYATRRIWWAWPLYLFSITPGFRTLFDRAYRKFADHRHQISAACKLPPGDSD